MNGCYNREPLRETIWAQNGWYGGMTSGRSYPAMVELPVGMTKDCQYSLTTKDAKCAGCRWNQGGKEE